MSCRVVCGCRGTRDMADAGDVSESDNKLGAKGAAAVAGALSKLVNLTSLNLGCTKNVEGLVCCVYVWCGMLYVDCACLGN